MLYTLGIKTKAFISFLFRPDTLFGAGIGSIVLSFFEKYLFSDWELLRWMVALMGLESLTCLYKDIKKRQLSKHTFDEMVNKSIIYGFMLILYNILENYTIRGNHPFELDLFSRYLVMAIVLKESLAVVENLAAVTKLVPSWLIDKMRLLSDKGVETDKQEPSVNFCQENAKENKPS